MTVALSSPSLKIGHGLPGLALADWRLTRFQTRRDRVIGDSQVRFDAFHALTLELADRAGRRGIGFAHAMWDPLPPLSALEDSFAAHVWPGLDGRIPAALVHRVDRPRGGNQRDIDHGFGEALQIALWDLAAQQAGLPLAKYLGGERNSVPVYASGLDFHLSDDEYAAFFTRAAELGFTAFKIKVGHPDVEWDITFCRRAAMLDVPQLNRPAGDGPLHLAIHATGLKVHGEGAWKVRTHGKDKRRVWRKQWKQETGYHRRSLAEAAMGRYRPSSAPA